MPGRFLGVTPSASRLRVASGLSVGYGPAHPTPMSVPKPPRPTFNAMLICDNTIREEVTGKVSLIGIFAAIQSPAFPVVVPSLCVYLNVSDAQGRYRLRLEL